MYKKEMQLKEIKISYQICSFQALSIELQSLIIKAKEQTELSYSIYSGFSVGAAILLEDGTIVCGNNQENVAYPSGLCAERVAMFYANSQYPHLKPKAIAIAAKNKTGFISNPISPCGGCRQVLLEYEMRSGYPIKTILYGAENIILIDNIADMLPFAFKTLN